MQVQRVPEKVAEKVQKKVLGIFGAGPGQVPTGSTGFPALGSERASERFVKIKCCGRWGYPWLPPKLTVNSFSIFVSFFSAKCKVRQCEYLRTCSLKSSGFLSS